MIAARTVITGSVPLLTRLALGRSFAVALHLNAEFERRRD
jgi:hypothetical protein